MKGGVAAIVAAVEALAKAGVRLRGDLVVSTVTDEESTSAGAVATVARGVRPTPRSSRSPPAWASASPAGEPDAVHPRAGPGQPRGRRPTALERRRRDQRHREGRRRPGLDHPAARALARRPPGPAPAAAAASVVATTIVGGQWPVSYADSCRVDCHISYLPEQADADGYGSTWSGRSRSGCSPTRPGPVAVRAPAHRDLVHRRAAHRGPRRPSCRRGAERCQPRPRAPRAVFGADFWHDGATFARAAGIPSVVYGPGDVRLAHAADEFVPVSDLVASAAGFALAAMRFCGVEED
jgi:acetylornithine deacetylase